MYLIYCACSNEDCSCNLVPRVLSLPRESTLVAAGHVSRYTNQIHIGGGSLT